jgi:hypothetical protein
MRSVHHALITAIALAALTASAADAQYAPRSYADDAQYVPRPYGAGAQFAPSPYDAYDYAGGPSGETYYSYGADRAHPSLSPNGWDLGDPRDFQLQGTR